MPQAMSEDELVFLAAAILLAPNHNVGFKVTLKLARELYAEVRKTEKPGDDDYGALDLAKKKAGGQL